jgi:Plasmid recombination enzyme
MMKAIARIAKLKGGNLSASEQHTSRERDTPNANPNQANQRLIDASTQQTLEQQIRQRLGDQRIRKDAVLCVELLLSVSPEYFRPTEPSRAGYWEIERLERFQWTVQQWLTQQYGDRVLRAELHLDEATPHIHAYIIPMDEQGRLNCKGLFGDREKLRQFQDSYAQALEPLGVERGIRGSRATHTAIQDYYAAVMQEPDQALDADTIRSQLSDRSRALKERNELEQTARALERENVALKEQIQQQEKSLAHYRAMSASMRNLQLERVAAELGLKPAPNQSHRWQGQGYNLNLNDNKFYDWQALKGGGGAIDLVMYVQKWDFKAAIVWLRDLFGESVTLQAAVANTRAILQSEPMRLFTLPEPAEQHWQVARSHLTQPLKFPTRLIDRLHKQGLIYADSKQDIVFVYRSLERQEKSGASLYLIQHSTWQTLEMAQGWFYLDPKGQSRKPPQRIVLVDSPTEAIAKYLLEQPQQVRSAKAEISPRSLYLAVDEVEPLLLEKLQEFSQITLACSSGRQLELMQHIVSSCGIEEPRNATWQTDLVGVLMQNLPYEVGRLQASTQTVEFE